MKAGYTWMVMHKDTIVIIVCCMFYFMMIEISFIHPLLRRRSLTSHITLKE